MTKTLFALCSSLIIIAACTAHKKSTTSTATTTAVTTTTVATTTTTESTATVAATPLFVKPYNGIYEPREEELTAIKTQFPDATLEKLKEGYFIYSKGACTKCHETVNIYHIDPYRWGFICDNMAMKANLTQTQKEAVYQYVKSIQATKSK